jgi:hypothetical protein
MPFASPWGAAPYPAEDSRAHGASLEYQPQNNFGNLALGGIQGMM